MRLFITKLYLLWSILFLFLSVPIHCSKGIVYAVSDYPGPLFVNIDNTNNLKNPLILLREAIERLGYRFKQVGSVKNLQNYEHIICIDIPVKELDYLKNYPKEKLTAVLLEPPSVRPWNYDRSYHHYFGKIFTQLDAMVDYKTYFKYFAACPNLSMFNDLPKFHERKLLVMFAGNKGSNFPGELYSERRRFIEFCEKNKQVQFDFFGVWWDSSRYHNYRGFAADKFNIGKHYKFAICYENVQGLDGYITEKLFDAFITATVPIYWGPTNITKYVPSNCFISASRFHSPEEIYSFISNITQEEYSNYIFNIRKFLSSDAVLVFKDNNFAHLVLSRVLKDYDTSILRDSQNDLFDRMIAMNHKLGIEVIK